MPTPNSRIAKGFGEKTRTAAPVQTEEDGWYNYLSKNEQQGFDHAHKHSDRGMKIAAAGAIAYWGAKLLLGATIAPPVLLVSLGIGVYGLAKAVKNHHRGHALQKEGERREGEVEVMRRRGVLPRRSPV